jgi:hypothetical protein
MCILFLFVLKLVETIRKCKVIGMCLEIQCQSTFSCFIWGHHWKEIDEMFVWLKHIPKARTTISFCFCLLESLLWFIYKYKKNIRVVWVMNCLGWRIEFNGRNGLANSPKEPPEKAFGAYLNFFNPNHL